MPILYFFPDTNFFIQCRPFGELDWGRWSDFDEVHLIVTRPVQSEIDQHKYRGSDRLAKRARLASSLLRDIVKSSDGHRIVHASRPLVKLLLGLDLKPDGELRETLKNPAAGASIG